MMLFATMCGFIFLIIRIIFSAKAKIEQWTEVEKMIQDPEQIVCFLEDFEKRELDIRNSNIQTKTKNLGWTYEKLDWALTYMALRAEFISPRDSSNRAVEPLKHDFDYADYLSCCLTHDLAEIVEVPLRTWIFIELVFVAMYGLLILTNANAIIMYYIIVGTLYANVFFLVLLNRKLAWIRTQLIVNRATGDKHSWFLGWWFLGQEVVTPSETIPFKGAATEMRDYGSTGAPSIAGAVQDEPAEERPLPKYLADYKVQEPRSEFWKYFLGDLPNAHEVTPTLSDPVC